MAKKQKVKKSKRTGLYHVTLWPVVTVRLFNVKARSARAALRKALDADTLDLNRILDQRLCLPNQGYVEFNADFEGANVDEVLVKAPENDPTLDAIKQHLYTAEQVASV